MITRSLEEVAKEFYALLPELQDDLVENGLDPFDPNVVEACIITAHTVERQTQQERNSIKEATDEARSSIEDAQVLLKEHLTQLEEERRQSRAWFNVFQWSVAALGAGAAAGALITKFPAFKNAIEALTRSITGWNFLSSAAYAAVGERLTADPSVLPVIVYGIYSLLAVGYVISFVGFVFGQDAKTRTNCFEYIKQLTAFFIGVVGGKIV